MPGYTTIEFEIEDGVGTVWLNRPEKRNALVHETYFELDDVLRLANDDDDIKVLLLRGRGESFCAGGDLNMLEGEVGSVATSLAINQRTAHTFSRLQEMRKPTVAVVHGHAVAGGFELMLNTDFAISTTTAKIGDFHITRALFGGGGPIYRLPRIMGMRRAKELILTGKLISGVEAERLDLVNVAVEPENLEEAVRAFIKPMLSLSPFVMWVTKLALNRGLDGDTTTLMAMEHLASVVVHQSTDSK
ncbi:MAG: enoyl-CoA hydratase/isomerase family protein, partial [Acidimicrobiales bacterium]